jgi:hypothetical protein
MNEWAQTKLLQDPNCSKQEIMRTGNDEWNSIKKDSDKKKLKTPDNNKRKDDGVFSVRDLHEIVLDFVNRSNVIDLERNESKLNELIDQNASKTVMVDNFLHMFATYKKSLKVQRNEIDKMLRKAKSCDQIQPVKRLKQEINTLQDKHVREASYSVASVYEMDVNGVSVIRRKSDDWVNATTILKAAGIGKGRKKRKTLGNISGSVQIIQGGYWKLQGTW